MAQELSPQDAIRYSRAAYNTDRGKWSDYKKGEAGSENRLFGNTGGGRFNPPTEGGLLHLESAMGYVEPISSAPGSVEYVVGMRGTQTLADIITDARVVPKVTGDFGRVHGGFFTTFASYRDRLMKLLPPVGKVAQIHCVGHSLGGALATLNGHFLASQGFSVKVYSFGSPRVYLDWSGAGFAKLVPDRSVFRVAHATDPIPMLPQFPFWHVGGREGHYELSSDTMNWLGVNPYAHKAGEYYETVKNQSWESLRRQAALRTWEDRLVHAIQHDDNIFSKVAKYGVWAVAKVVRALVRLIGKAIGVGLTFLGFGLDASINFIDAAAYVLWQGLKVGGQVSVWVGQALVAMARVVGMQVVDASQATLTLIRYLFDRLLQALVSTVRQADTGAG